MENKKNVLITIIVLLCIFVPLSIIGLLSNKNISIIEDNPNHEKYYDGYIWFYNDNDEFLNKYECLTEICEYTNTIIDDDVYGINYYKDGKITNTSLLSNKYTLITDGSLVHLYSLDTGKTLQSYKAVKNYNTTIENNSYIIQNSDGVWGVLSISDMLKAVLPFEYSFIGLKNNLNSEGILNASKFIVQKDTKWFLVDNNNSALSGYINEPIIDYNENYIFSKYLNRIRIYSYDNHEYFSVYNIKDYILEDKYIGIVTDTFLLIYDNLGESYIKSLAITNVSGKISLVKEDNKLNVKIDGEITESIELN